MIEGFDTLIQIGWAFHKSEIALMCYPGCFWDEFLCQYIPLSDDVVIANLVANRICKAME